MKDKELISKVGIAYNTLDYKNIEDVAAENIIYESQNVFTPLIGKGNVTEFLRKKFQAIKKSGSVVTAELATLPHSRRNADGTLSDLPCIILSQDGKKVCLMLIEHDQDKITRIDICSVAPHWSSAKGTGIFPV